MTTETPKLNFHFFKEAGANFDRFTQDFDNFLKKSLQAFYDISKSLPKIEKNINNEIMEAEELIHFFFKEHTDQDHENDNYGITLKIFEYSQEINKISDQVREMMDKDHIFFNEISDSIKEIKSLISDINEMTEISDDIKVYAINSIIIASNSGTKGKGFKVLSQEFIKFSQHMMVLGEKLIETSDQVLKFFHKYEASTGKLKELEAETIDILTNKIAGAFNNLEKGFKNSAGLFNNIIDRVNTSKSSISKIMVNMQAQDIIQQQFEHIMNSLKDVKNEINLILSEIPLEDSDMTKIEPAKLHKLGDLYDLIITVTNVNIKQCQRIESDVNTFIDTNTTTLREMDNTLNEIMEDNSFILNFFLEKDDDDSSGVSNLFKESEETVNKGIGDFEESAEIKNNILILSKKLSTHMEKLDTHFYTIQESLEVFKQMGFLLKIETSRFDLGTTKDGDSNISVISESILHKIEKILESYYATNSSIKHYMQSYKENYEGQKNIISEVTGKLNNSQNLLSDSKEVVTNTLTSLVGFTADLKNEIRTAIDKIESLGDMKEKIPGYIKTLRFLNSQADTEFQTIKKYLNIDKWNVQIDKINSIINKYTVASELDTAQEVFQNTNIEIEPGDGNEQITLF